MCKKEILNSPSNEAYFPRPPYFPLTKIDRIVNLSLRFFLEKFAGFRQIMDFKGGTIMAITAYIFIETTQGKARTIAREIGQIPGIKTAHTVTGPYDVITFVEADSIRILGDFIVTKIQATPGVLRTLTNVVIDAE